MTTEGPRHLARPSMYVGTIAIVLSLGIAHARLVGHYQLEAHRLFWNVLYAIFLCIAAYSVGLPDIDSGNIWIYGTAAAAGGAASISVVQLALGSQLLPRALVLSATVAIVPWLRLSTRLSSASRNRDLGRDQVLFVGPAFDYSHLQRDLQSNVEKPAALVGCVNTSRADVSIASSELADMVSALGATLVVFSRPAALRDELFGVASTLHRQGLRIRTTTAFYEEWLGKIRLEEIDRFSLMCDIEGVHRARYARVKRLLDIIIALIGLVILIALCPIIIIGNLIGNPGPLIYAQRRVGKDQTVFVMYKFRTMRPTSAESAEWASEGDLRITPFGGFLRRTHIDELPQVVNVLKGDQAIVGPRPEQPSYVETLGAVIPFYHLRHLVRPGLTGWAQVNHPYGASEDDAREKLQYDLFYLRNQTLVLDARVIGRTLRHVVRQKGR